MSRFSRHLLALLLAAMLSLFVSAVADAHGRATAGDYALLIGFRSEPAFKGEANALDLVVANTKTKEKINGLADTLKVEIGFGTTKQALKLRPQTGHDGAYIAYVVPTESGLYTWHIFGKIKDTPVDVSMTSGPNTFSAVVATSEVAFPAAKAPDEPLAQAATAQAAQAAQQAQQAMTIGIVGAALGGIGMIVGIVVGLAGLRARGRDLLRKRPAALKA